MSPALNSYLGIAFLFLGLASTLLMYHLWGYPYDKEKHQSSAPRWLMNLHRLMGYAFLAIYLILMWQMVPRLWNYQIELPARTVVYLTLGIAIGAILILKLSIVIFFRHLEGTLVPMLGTMLMICTILVICLSVPFSLRESYLNAQIIPDSITGTDSLLRVRRLLKEAGQDDEAFRAELASIGGLAAGREVLHSSCTQCHDLRTVLAKPRSSKNWWSTVKRMAGMSNLLDPIDENEQWQVTSYLIAISPDLNKPQKKAVAGGPPLTLAIDASQEATTPKATINKPAGFDPNAAAVTFQDNCTQCHKISKIDNYDFTDSASVIDIVKRMIVEQELELSQNQKQTIEFFMASKYLSDVAVKNSANKNSKASEETAEQSTKAESTNDSESGDDAQNTQTIESVAKPKNYSSNIGKFLFNGKCNECHKSDRIEKYTIADYQAAAALIKEMIGEGLKVNEKEQDFLTYYLFENYKVSPQAPR